MRSDQRGGTDRTRYWRAEKRTGAIKRPRLQWQIEVQLCERWFCLSCGLDDVRSRSITPYLVLKEHFLSNCRLHLKHPILGYYF